MVTLVDSDEQFAQVCAESQAARKPLIVDFSAAWCGPCKRMYPQFIAIAERYGALATFVKVDIDAAAQTAADNGVTAVPHIRALDATGTPLFDLVGAETMQLDAAMRLMFGDGQPTVVGEESQPAEAIADQANDDDIADENESAPLYKLIEIGNDEDWIHLANAVAQRRVPTLVQFSATWCGPCRRMYPVIDELVEQMGDRFIFARVDIDGARQIAQTYQVSAVPHFAIFDADGRSVDELRGADRSALVNLVLKYANSVSE